MSTSKQLQEELKRLEETEARDSLIERWEQEFTNISKKKKLTKADWIMLAATFASQLEASQAIQKSLPKLATELIKLGRSRNAKPGSDASAKIREKRRAEIGEWLLQNYTRETYAKRGAVKATLQEAIAKFPGKLNPKTGERTELDGKTLRKIAIEFGLLD